VLGDIGLQALQHGGVEARGTLDRPWLRMRHCSEDIGCRMSVKRGMREQPADGGRTAENGPVCRPSTRRKSMNFRITGLSPEPFTHLFGLSEAELAKHGVLRYVAGADSHFPD